MKKEMGRRIMRSTLLALLFVAVFTHAEGTMVTVSQRTTTLSQATDLTISQNEYTSPIFDASACSSIMLFVHADTASGCNISASLIDHYTEIELQGNPYNGYSYEGDVYSWTNAIVRQSALRLTLYSDFQSTCVLPTKVTYILYCR